MSDSTDGEEILEEEDPNEAAIAWAAEIKRRVDEVRSGKAKLISGAEVSRQLRAIIAGEEE